eukprot:TRINITY_DN75488_c0_g1_i1.p1 TRINITY_DN75488_c0_g1~~TRINITY_DN75488_c0_g1_i1.p1  ORF type:complete len:755 (+),score=81.06 TRINITY_DN75488_c0_g1_i1:75-2339(+)
MAPPPALLLAISANGPAAALVRGLNRTWLPTAQVSVVGATVTPNQSQSLPREIFASCWGVVLLLCDTYAEYTSLTAAHIARVDRARSKARPVPDVMELESTFAATKGAWTRSAKKGACNSAYSRLLLAAHGWGRDKFAYAPRHGQIVPVMMLHLPRHKKYIFAHAQIVLSHLENGIGEHSPDYACCPAYGRSNQQSGVAATAPSSSDVATCRNRRLWRGESPRELQQRLTNSRAFSGSALVAAFPGGPAAAAARKLNNSYLFSLVYVQSILFGHRTQFVSSPMNIFARHWSAVVILCDDYFDLGFSLETVARNPKKGSSRPFWFHRTRMTKYPAELRSNVVQDPLAFPRFANGLTPAPSRCNEAFFHALMAARGLQSKGPILLAHVGLDLHKAGPRELELAREVRHVIMNALSFYIMYGESALREVQTAESRALAPSRAPSEVIDEMQSGPCAAIGSVGASVEALTVVTREAERDFLLRDAVGASYPGCLVNVGQGRRFRGWMSRIEMLRDYLELSVQGNASPDRLVVVMDGTDFVWGGCSQEDFLARYADIANRSKRAVVFGAELACQDRVDCSVAPQVPGWAQTMTKIPDLPGGFWRERTQCFATGGDWCDIEPAMRHLNSGFMVGPAAALKDLFSMALDDFTVVGQRDQGVFVKLFDTQEVITLDYGSSLVLNIDGVRMDQVNIRGSDIFGPLSASAPLCFLHAQGGAKRHLHKFILPSLRRGSGDTASRLRKWRSEGMTTQRSDNTHHTD